MAATELDIYLNEPFDPEITDIMEFWKVNSSRFPILSRIAKDYLANCPTSAASERAFSGGRDLLGIRRYCLSKETMRSLRLLKSYEMFGRSCKG